MQTCGHWWVKTTRKLLLTQKCTRIFLKIVPKQCLHACDFFHVCPSVLRLRVQLVFLKLGQHPTLFSGTERVKDIAIECLCTQWLIQVVNWSHHRGKIVTTRVKVKVEREIEHILFSQHLFKTNWVFDKHPHFHSMKGFQNEIGSLRWGQTPIILSLFCCSCC